eukprot:5206994-Karenia_brevis.AAC.1
MFAGLPGRSAEDAWFITAIQAEHSQGIFGQAHRFPCGIPQGCPLSMLFVCILLRPWHRQMCDLGAKPRSLADDMFITSVGSDALGKFNAAFNATLIHIGDFGGRVATSKTKIFATNATHRNWLRNNIWGPISSTVQI